MVKSIYKDGENPEGLNLAPLLERPQRVAIVALGSSAVNFIHEQISVGTTARAPFDEVWTVNRGLRSIVHDKLFVLDDLRWLERKDAAYANFLKQHNRPFFTSTVYPEYPNAIEYPLMDVIQSVGDDMWCVNTVAYMVAYAIHLGVKDLSVYGADFIYPNGNKAEEGGQAVAYLLGIGKGKGMHYRVPANSTLMYANKVKVQNGTMQRIYYGWHRKDEMARPAMQVVQPMETKPDGSANRQDPPVRDRPGHKKGIADSAESAVGG